MRTSHGKLAVPTSPDMGLLGVRAGIIGRVSVIACLGA